MNHQSSGAASSGADYKEETPAPDDKKNKDGGTVWDMQRNSSGVEQDNAGFGGLVFMFFLDK